MQHPPAESLVAQLDHEYEVAFSSGRMRDALDVLKRWAAAVADGLGAGSGAAAQALVRQSELQSWMDDFQGAESAARDALGILEGLHGRGAPGCLPALNALTQALVLENLERPDAEPCSRAALAVLEAHPEIASTRDGVRARCLAAQVLANLDRYAESLGEAARAMEALRPMEEAGADVLLQGEVHLCMGRAQGRVDAMDAAHAALDRAQAILAARLGSGHPLVAEVVGQQGIFFQFKSMFAQAEACFRAALPVFEQCLGPAHTLLAGVLNNLGTVVEDRDLQPGLYSRAHAMVLGLRPAWHSSALLYRANLGYTFELQGRDGEALGIYREVLELADAHLRPDCASLVGFLASLSSIECRLGDLSGARVHAERGVAIAGRLYGPAHWRLGNAHWELAEVEFAEGRFAEAASLYERVVETRTRSFGECSWAVLAGCRRLAQCHRSLGRHSDEEAVSRRTLGVARNLPDAEEAVVARDLNLVGLAVDAQGRSEEALALFRESLAIYERVCGPLDGSILTLRSNVAYALLDLGRDAEGQEMLRRTVDDALAQSGESSAGCADALAALARYEGRAGIGDRGEALLRRQVSILEILHGPDDGALDDPLCALAGRLADAGRHGEAEAVLRRVLGLRCRVAPESPGAAHALNLVGLAVDAQGRSEESLALFRESLAIYERARKPLDGSILTLRSNAAYTLLDLGRDAEGQAMLARTVADALARDGADSDAHAAALGGLARFECCAGLDAQGEYHRGQQIRILERLHGAEAAELREPLSDLADFFLSRDRLDECDATYGRLIPLLRSGGAPCEDALAQELLRRGQCLLRLGRTGEAHAACLEALGLRERLDGPGHPLVGRSLSALADVLDAGDHFDEAEPLRQRAYGIQAASGGPESAVSMDALQEWLTCLMRMERHAAVVARALDLIRARKANPSGGPGALLLPLRQLAIAYLGLGEDGRAEEILLEARALVADAMGGDPLWLGRLMRDFARLCASRNDNGAAIVRLEEGISILEKAFGADDPSLLPLVEDLAYRELDAGEHFCAERDFARVLAIREQVQGADHPDCAYDLEQLARLREDDDDPQAACALVRRALALWQSAGESFHPRVAGLLNQLARLHESMGEQHEALRLYGQALACREAVYGADHALVSASLNNLALCQQALGMDAEAAENFDRAVSVARAACDPESIDMGIVIKNCAADLVRRGDYAKADPLADEALGIIGRQPRTDPGLHASAWELRGDVDRGLSRWDAAASAYASALALTVDLGVGAHEAAVRLKLAEVHLQESRHDAADLLCERALSVLDGGGADPVALADALDLWARVKWALGQDAEAMRLDLRAAGLRPAGGGLGEGGA